MYIYTHVLLINLLTTFYWGCYDWKSLKICPFSKIWDQNIHFWIFSKNSFDTEHLICKNFHFVCRGFPGGPRILKKIWWYLKIILVKVCKKIFFIKAKKKFLCPKFKDQNLHFWIFSKNSFRNEVHTPFLPYFDTQHLMCKNLHFVRRGVSGGPRTKKKFNDI